MSTHKHINLICIVIIIAAMVLTVLFMNGQKLGLQVKVDEDAEDADTTGYFTENDLACDWDTAEINRITLDGDDGTVKGTGAYFLDGDLIICSPGYYDLSGTLTDGSIVVSAEDNDKVFIRLSGVSITNSEDSCIVVENADKTFLTLADDTANTLESGSDFDDEAVADNREGVICSHDDLTINGTGSLNITAESCHGIDAKDTCVITNGQITINTPLDGIHVNDSFRLCRADLTINASDDGIHSDDEVIIASGTVLINDCYEGIEGLQITMLDGDVTIYPTDDGINANGSSDTFGFGTMGGGQMQIGGNQTFGNAKTTADASDSETTDKITDTTGDDTTTATTGNDSNDNTADVAQAPSGGTAPTDMTPPDMNTDQSSDGTTSASGTDSDDTTDDTQAPSGGTAPSGMQMPTDGNAPTDMTPPDTDMDMSSDEEMPDGMQNPADNAAASTEDPSAETDTSTEDQTSDDTADDEDTSTDDEDATFFRISGGTLTIVNETGMDADGIDSNGDIYIEGGEIYVSMSGTGSNAAIDYGSENGGECQITGGTLIACGGSSMVESISDSSTQPSILYTGENVTAGATVSLSDSEGNVLLSWEVPCACNAVCVSCPEMQTGQTYTLALGDTTEEISVDSVVTQSGSASSGMGGMGGQMQMQNQMQGGNQSTGGNGTQNMGPKQGNETASDGNADQNSPSADTTNTDTDDPNEEE